MKVDAYAGQPHYAAHLEPIWNALPDSLKGVFYGRPGDPPTPGGPRSTTPVLVAGHVDRYRVPGRPVILVEHGSGQAYHGDPLSAPHGSYSGGAGWEHAIGFLCPSETVARRWRAVYEAPAVPVGPPTLDRWYDVGRTDSPRPIVAFTFHWDCLLVNESRSAYDHYRKHLADIVGEFRFTGHAVVGHSHPRWRSKLTRMWADLGVPSVSLDDIMASASVLVADNTSVMYEFAALDRPVVALNAPWYRRDVNHGLRFWSHVPGIQVDHPANVVTAVSTALSDGWELAEQRRRAVYEAYGHLDGRASARAAEAVADIVGMVR